MKQLERTILSIIRRPLKTGILILLIFVVANIISGTLILYQSTQLLKENIQSKIRPTIVLDSEYSITVPHENDWQFNYAEFEKTMKVMDEISEMNQIVYSGYSVIDPWVYSKESIKTNIMASYSDENYGKIINSYKSHPIVGVSNHNSVLFKNSIIAITKGRNFTEEEIKSNDHKIIVNDQSYFIDDNGIRRQIELGDKIKLVDYIIDKEKYLKEAMLYEIYFTSDYDYQENLKLGRIKEYNDWYNSLILYEKEYEFEVIGFYNDYKIANGEKKYYQDAEIGYTIDNNGYYMIIPLKALLEMQNDRINMNHQLLSDKKITTSEDNSLFLLNNYSQLYNSEAIEDVSNRIKDKIEKEHLKIDVCLNNDIYLKIAGPLDGINSISKFLLGVGIGVSIVVLACISILFMKERRNEIGILLAMGESKKHIMKQVLLEMLIICSLGIAGSMFTSRGLCYLVSDKLINNSYEIELSEEEKMMIDEDYTSNKVLNDFQHSLSTTNLFAVSCISLIVSLVSTSFSALYVIKMKPKEILL